MKLGIFWHYKGEVIGRTVPLSKGEESCPGLLDSPINHTDVWEGDRTLLADFPELRGQEYFSIPRGRVLWNEAGQYAIVYMDAILFNDRSKKLIADFFNLGGCVVKWRKDVHYTTSSDDLVELFDD